MCISPKAALTAKAPSLISMISVEADKHYHTTLRQSNNNVENLHQQRRKAFLAQEPEFHCVVHIDRIRCPLHVLKFNLAFKNLAPNQTLKLASTSQAVINDLSAVCKIFDISTRVLNYRRCYYFYAFNLEDEVGRLQIASAQKSPGLIEAEITRPVAQCANLQI